MENPVIENGKVVAKRSPTCNEQKSIERIREKGYVKSQPIFRACETEGKENVELALDENLDVREAIDLLDSSILEATGSANRNVGISMLINILKAIAPTKSNNKEAATRLDTVAQSMQMMAPQDEYEGQLVAQLIILHEHALDYLGRANRTERVDFANVYLNGASKLLTRHHETLEALLKYRRKGEQRVHVEHIHVYGGGQAVVGNITSGGGLKPIIEEGPHAKV